MADELPFEIYDFWLFALRKNNVQVVEKTLDLVDDQQKKKLLNGKFVFSGENNRKLAKDTVNFTRAWCVAVSCGSWDVIKAFIKHGVNPSVSDFDGNNILHVLAYTAFVTPEEENKVRDTYAFLRTALSENVVLQLLKMTNDNGMRPTEVACHLGAFGVFLDMFETPGLHLVEQSRNGINLTQWFDITEYESHKEGNRRKFCPIIFIMLLDRSTLKYSGARELFKSDLIQKWIQADFRTTAPFIFLWFLLRISFAVLVFTFDGTLLGMEERNKLKLMNTTANETCLSSAMNSYQLNETGIFITASWLIFYAIGGILVDATELSGYFNAESNLYIRTPNGKKDMLMHYEFYRLVQIVLHFCTIALVVVKLSRVYGGAEISSQVDNLLFTAFSLSNFWSYMQFAQVLPRIGHFAITLQRMLGTMVIFLIIFVFFSLTFSEALYRIINRGREECSADFDTTMRAWYSTFLAIINMLDFTRYDVMDEVALYVLHAVIVFMVGILLINFLIALFSSTVAWVDQYKDIIVTVQRLSVAVILEERLVQVIGCFYRKTQMKNFVSQDGRFYITRCIVGKQKNRLKKTNTVSTNPAILQTKV